LLDSLLQENCRLIDAKILIDLGPWEDN